MKRRFPLGVFLAILLLPLALRAQPAETRERVEAAYMIALGRGPEAAELKTAATGASVSVKSELARLQGQLERDAALQRRVATQAFADAFGRAPTDADLAAAGKGTYTDLLKRHVDFLKNHPGEYANVLNRAYQFVIRRDVYPEEIEYWKKHDVLSYALLVGCVDNWGRRNQPGLMVTAGTPAISINCSYITAIRLSPAVAAEARTAAGLAPVTDAASGHHIVAPAAGKIVSDGRIHFLLSGGTWGAAK